jgi:Na+-transporting NADH:ubiquinone oxidoreductase subunit C
MAINKNSTSYILAFSVILITVTALLLSSLSINLKAPQKQNVENEKRIFILSAAGEFTIEEAGKKSQSEISQIFDSKIKSYVIDAKGKVIEGEKAFNLDVVREFKLTSKNPEKRKYALFTYTLADGSEKYIIPMAGNGLWGPVWSYVALKSDKNTIDGIVFDHKSETPGLGAEITQKWFRDAFVNSPKQILDEKGVYKSISLVKGGVKNPNHEVDAIAGSTITSKGVSSMLKENFYPYMLYWEKIK